MLTIEELAKRVQILEDEKAILHTLYEYGHVLDYGRDPDQWVDLFTEDGVWKGTPVTTHAGAGSGDRVEGHAALAEWLFRGGRSEPEYWEITGHRASHNSISMPDIKIDGDRATVESTLTITREDPTGPIVFAIGRFLDVLVRCPDGKWRFKVRHLERTCVEPAGQVRPMQTPTREERIKGQEKRRAELAATPAGNGR